MKCFYLHLVKRTFFRHNFFRHNAFWILPQTIKNSFIGISYQHTIQINFINHYYINNDFPHMNNNKKRRTLTSDRISMTSFIWDPTELFMCCQSLGIIWKFGTRCSKNLQTTYEKIMKAHTLINRSSSTLLNRKVWFTKKIRTFT